MGLGVVALLLAACGSSRGTPTTTTRAPTPTTSSTPGAVTPTNAVSGPTSPSSASAPVGWAQLSQVVCPTTYGIPPTGTPSLPPTVAESIPSDLAGQVAVYTDAQGQMQILAPTGWSCSAAIGADGTSELAAYPHGQPDPTSSSTASDTGEQVVGGQTSACASCLYEQTTPLFTAAASQCAVDYAGTPVACPGPYAGESSESIGAGIVGFLDPPGVKGSGAGSGGVYPANGVVTYHPATAARNGSYIETCTLPGSQHALCTTALDDFVVLYGTR
jgi:hypothetical protein